MTTSKNQGNKSSFPYSNLISLCPRHKSSQLRTRSLHRRPTLAGKISAVVAPNQIKNNNNSTIYKPNIMRIKGHGSQTHFAVFVVVARAKAQQINAVVNVLSHNCARNVWGIFVGIARKLCALNLGYANNVKICYVPNAGKLYVQTLVIQNQS